jgi:hypothetical protein
MPRPFRRRESHRRTPGAQADASFSLFSRASGHDRGVDDLDGVARDAETLLDVLRRFSEEGFTGSFSAVDTGGTKSARLRCETCHEEFGADAPDVTELRRLEGASDPDDMLAVAALRCPRCSTCGALVLNYGPTAAPADAAALLALRHPVRDAR